MTLVSVLVTVVAVDSISNSGSSSTVNNRGSGRGSISDSGSSDDNISDRGNSIDSISGSNGCSISDSGSGRNNISNRDRGSGIGNSGAGRRRVAVCRRAAGGCGGRGKVNISCLVFAARLSTPRRAGRGGAGQEKGLPHHTCPGNDIRE